MSVELLDNEIARRLMSKNKNLVGFRLAYCFGVKNTGSIDLLRVWDILSDHGPPLLSEDLYSEVCDCVCVFFFFFFTYNRGERDMQNIVCPIYVCV